MEWNIKFRAGGKMTIPIEIRHALKLTEGSTITLKIEEDKMTVVNPRLSEIGFRRLQEKMKLKNKRYNL